MAKRALDLTIVIFTLPITGLAMLMAAIALRVFQGKGVLFRQKRIGKNGMPFELVKFRTMREGSGDDIERTTWVGSIMRKLSVDELPEIYNILKGEMSIVGPRPLPIHYKDFFTPEEFSRHQVTPGLTGQAQVFGRNLFSWKDKFENDLKYIENRSIGLDIKIIVKTFFAVFNVSKVNASVDRTMLPLTDRVYIVGAGGHGKVAFEAALAQGHEVAGVFDDNPELLGKPFYTIRVRPTSEIPEGALVFLAIGNNETRKALSTKWKRFATLIHPKAHISPTAIIREGSAVFMGASVQADTTIEKHVIVNTNASVDHDCHIADFAHIAPGANLCGGVKVGEKTLVGVGSKVSPLCSLPSNTVVGAGSTVIEDLGVSGLYVGAPARLKKEYLMEEKNKNIAMAMPDITELEVQAAAEVVRSKRLALGENIPEFEKLFARYTGRKHAIAVSSGTAGLHLSLMALGVGKGDEVLVPSYTFVASVNCILYVGAIPVFVDVDDKTFCVCPKDAKNKITEKTKAMVSVDVFGHPAPLDKLEKLCKDNGLYLIDDSCEALGAEVNGVKVGKYGDVASFAFYPNKQITTGEGGMIVTDNDEVAKNCRIMMNQGRDSMSQWLEHVQLGYNFRMSEVQAAIGVVQMKRLEEILSKREQVANWYLENLKGFKGLTTQNISSNAKMSWFVFVVTLDEGMDRDLVISQLQERGIPSRAYFTPIHTQPYLNQYETRGKEHLPVTNKVGKLTMALPFYGDMPKADVDYVCEQLKDVVRSYETHTHTDTNKAA